MNSQRTLHCRNCQTQRLMGLVDMLNYLRAVGKLRRDPNPPADIVIELFSIETGNMSCESCGAAALSIEEAIGDFDDWGPSRMCEACRAEIPAERLEVFPDATRCANCQDKPLEEEPDYCPKCGAIMTTRQRGGTGITRYEMHCPDCRK